MITPLKRYLLPGTSLVTAILVMIYLSQTIFIHQSNKESVSKLRRMRDTSYEDYEEEDTLENEQTPVVSADYMAHEGYQKDAALYIPEKRIVHLDLKGAPPKVNYFRELFPLLKTLGATGILLEYEDMFPFWGPIKMVAAKNAYTRNDIVEILRLAKANSLEIIPLVQTFGHLEFVLKVGDFRHLREVNTFPQALCPSRNESFELVRHIIDQVMELHPDIKYLHIGCDEVYQLAMCSDCHQRLRDNKRDIWSGKGWLFVNHVRRVAEYTKKTYNVQPIVWDDMLRGLSESDLTEYLGGGLVEPMVWVYVTRIYRFVDWSTWRKFGRVFQSAWTAGAFKGAFGPALYSVNTYRHLEATADWLEVMKQQTSSFDKGFRGLVLTGWQRYDHFANLCELLPAAIPSLATNLILLRKGRLDDSVLQEAATALNCGPGFKAPSWSSLQGNPTARQFSRCRFPGRDVFRLMRHYRRIRNRIHGHVTKAREANSWLTEYNVRHNYTNPHRVFDVTPHHPQLLRLAEGLRNEAKRVLSKVYDKYTVAEWMEQHIYPVVREIETLNNDSVKLLARDTWPVRPIESIYDDELNSQ